MRTVLLGERPPPVEEWLERRRALGQDLYDGRCGRASTTWHRQLRPGMGTSTTRSPCSSVHSRSGPASGAAAPLNLGTENNYRVPDRAYLAGRATTTFVPTAVVVVEILSPNDETWLKLDHYAAHGVEELIVVDPLLRAVTCLAREGRTMVEVPASARLRISADEIEQALDWPPVT